eukprot:7853379-Prorocentrum_lima.AAC.1
MVPRGHEEAGQFHAELCFARECAFLTESERINRFIIGRQHGGHASALAGHTQSDQGPVGEGGVTEGAIGFIDGGNGTTEDAVHARGDDF